MIETKFLTTKEAAELLGVSVEALYCMVRKKEIPYYKPFGNKLFFDIEDMADAIIQAREQKGMMPEWQGGRDIVIQRAKKIVQDKQKQDMRIRKRYYYQLGLKGDRRMKKYKLTDKTIQWKGRTLHRIVALCDFGDVKKGTKGGYIESEDNLWQQGWCWVADNAKVYDSAWIHGDALVTGKAEVFGRAEAFDRAVVTDNAHIHGSAWVRGDSIIRENADINDYAEVDGNAIVCGYAKIYDCSLIDGRARIYGNAEVGGSSEVACCARIGHNAKICSGMDYAFFRTFFHQRNNSTHGYVTWTRSNNMWEAEGAFVTGQELIARANTESLRREYELMVEYVKRLLEAEKGGER